MSTLLLSYFKEKRRVVFFFLLTYLDKSISFALPLVLLFVVKDNLLYTSVEVAYSYATIIIVVAEIGITNYLFFGYRESNDKERFIEKSELYFKALFVLYTILYSFGIGLLYMFGYENFILILLIGVRTQYLFYVNFYSNIYRLKETPSKIYVITLIVNLTSILLLIFADQFANSYTVVFFLFAFLILIIGASVTFLKDFHQFKLSEFLDFSNKALKFSWPIILNLLAMNFVNNYAKIYAYQNLSQQEMIEISFILRIGMIIQLTHSAFASYFSKSLFMDKSRKFDWKIFKKYAIIIGLSSALSILIILITDYALNSYILIDFNTRTVFFLLYIVLWCFVGYLELYFGVYNANRMILYFSIISSIVYIALLKSSTEISLNLISIFMLISGLLNLTMVIFGLRRLHVFSN